jgi:phenylalanyl-tRNA synthetase alpha chain
MNGENGQRFSLESIAQIRDRALAELAAVRDNDAAERFRVAYLGKKGALRELLKAVREVPEDVRKSFGEQANNLRIDIETEFEKGPWQTSSPENAVRSAVDCTLPGHPFPRGTLHPLMQITNEIRDIFFGMGFTIAYGPDIESDHYNFSALNFQPDHPARDMQDNFHVHGGSLLRTHTSPVQVRVMETQQPPIRSIMPGRVYRNEEISARSYCLFHQLEGLYIDENVSFADLKGTLLAFSRAFFDEKTRLKIRPSYFPFTEPSVEIDVECFLCKGKGCSICKKSGWLEILGAGMVHPNVLKSGNIDPEKYTGFAFGMGIERIALLKYGIDDIRLFYENDVRFLRQF